MAPSTDAGTLLDEFEDDLPNAPPARPQPTPAPRDVATLAAAPKRPTALLFRTAAPLIREYRWHRRSAPPTEGQDPAVPVHAAPGFATPAGLRRAESASAAHGAARGAVMAQGTGADAARGAAAMPGGGQQAAGTRAGAASAFTAASRSALVSATTPGGPVSIPGAAASVGYDQGRLVPVPADPSQAASAGREPAASQAAQPPAVTAQACGSAGRRGATAATAPGVAATAIGMSELGTSSPDSARTPPNTMPSPAPSEPKQLRAAEPPTHGVPASPTAAAIVQRGAAAADASVSTDGAHGTRQKPSSAPPSAAAQAQLRPAARPRAEPAPAIQDPSLATAPPALSHGPPSGTSSSSDGSDTGPLPSKPTTAQTPQSSAAAPAAASAATGPVAAAKHTNPPAPATDGTVAGLTSSAGPPHPPRSQPGPPQAGPVVGPDGGSLARARGMDQWSSMRPWESVQSPSARPEPAGVGRSGGALGNGVSGRDGGSGDSAGGVTKQTGVTPAARTSQSPPAVPAGAARAATASTEPAFSAVRATEGQHDVGLRAKRQAGPTVAGESQRSREPPPLPVVAHSRAGGGPTAAGPAPLPGGATDAGGSATGAETAGREPGIPAAAPVAQRSPPAPESQAAASANAVSAVDPAGSSPITKRSCNDHNHRQRPNEWRGTNAADAAPALTAPTLAGSTEAAGIEPALVVGVAAADGNSGAHFAAGPEQSGNGTLPSATLPPAGSPTSIVQPRRGDTAEPPTADPPAPPPSTRTAGGRCAEPAAPAPSAPGGSYPRAPLLPAPHGGAQREEQRHASVPQQLQPQQQPSLPPSPPEQQGQAQPHQQRDQAQHGKQGATYAVWRGPKGRGRKPWLLPPAELTAWLASSASLQELIFRLGRFGAHLGAGGTGEQASGAGAPQGQGQVQPQGQGQGHAQAQGQAHVQGQVQHCVPNQPGRHLNAVQLCAALTTAERLASDGSFVGKSQPSAPQPAPPPQQQQPQEQLRGVLAPPCRRLQPDQAAALAALLAGHAEVLADADPPEMARTLWAAARLRLSLPAAALEPALEAVWLWDPADPTANRQRSPPRRAARSPPPSAVPRRGSDGVGDAGRDKGAPGSGARDVMGPREVCLLVYAVSLLYPDYLRRNAGGFLEALGSYEGSAATGPKRPTGQPRRGADATAGGGGEDGSDGLTAEQVVGVVVALARADAPLDEEGQEFVLQAVGARLRGMSTPQVSALLAALQSWRALPAAPGGAQAHGMLLRGALGGLLQRLTAEHRRFLAAKQAARDAAAAAAQVQQKHGHEHAQQPGQAAELSRAEQRAQSTVTCMASDAAAGRALVAALAACADPRSGGLRVHGSVVSGLLRQIRYRPGVLNARDVCEALRLLASLAPQRAGVAAWNEGLRALLRRWAELLRSGAAAAGEEAAEADGGRARHTDEGTPSGADPGAARTFAATLHAVSRLGVTLHPAESAAVAAAAASLAPAMGCLADVVMALTALRRGAVGPAGAVEGTAEGEGAAAAAIAATAKPSQQETSARSAGSLAAAGLSEGHQPSKEAGDVLRLPEDGGWRWLSGGGVVQLGPSGRAAAQRVLLRGAELLRLRGAVPRSGELACLAVAAASLGAWPTDSWWGGWEAGVWRVMPPQLRPADVPQPGAAAAGSRNGIGPRPELANGISAVPQRDQQAVAPAAPAQRLLPAPQPRLQTFSAAEATDVLYSLARLRLLHWQQLRQQPPQSLHSTATPTEPPKAAPGEATLASPVHASSPGAAAAGLKAGAREDTPREPGSAPVGALPPSAPHVSRQLVSTLLLLACAPNRWAATKPQARGAYGYRRNGGRSFKDRSNRRPMRGQGEGRGAGAGAAAYGNGGSSAQPPLPPPMCTYWLAFSVWQLQLYDRREVALWAPLLAAAAPAALPALTPRKQVLLLCSLTRAFRGAGMPLPPAVGQAWLAAFAAGMARGAVRGATLASAAAAVAEARLAPPPGWWAAFRSAARERARELGVREVAALVAALRLHAPPVEPQQAEPGEPAVAQRDGDAALAQLLLQLLRRKLSASAPAGQNAAPASPAEASSPKRAGSKSRQGQSPQAARASVGAAPLSAADQVLARRLCVRLARGGAIAHSVSGQGITGGGGMWHAAPQLRMGPQPNGSSPALCSGLRAGRFGDDEDAERVVSCGRGGVSTAVLSGGGVGMAQVSLAPRPRWVNQPAHELSGAA